MRAILILAAPMLIGSLAACDRATDVDMPTEFDPAVAQALGDQLMVDPDLVGQNEASAALTGGSDQSLPLEIATTEAIRDAKQKALVLAGKNGVLPDLPKPGLLGQSASVSILADEVSRVVGPSQCMAGARQSAIWAARLPDALPIYPRGATQDAWGSDASGCAFRAIRFTTPIAQTDVAAFYVAIAHKAGFRPRYLAGEDERRIEGSRGPTRLAVHLRPGLDDTTEVDLIVAGA